MKSKIFLLLFLAFACTHFSSATVLNGIQTLGYSPNFPTVCYLPGLLQIPILRGQLIQLRGVCALMMCSSSAEWQQLNCEIPRVPQGCRLGRYDLTKGFPDCCQRVECPN